MYTVQKLSVTSRNTDGSPVYGFTLHFGTWRELVSDLAARSRYANELFAGKGAHVFCGEALLGNVREFESGELDGVAFLATTRGAFVAANLVLAD